MCSKISSIYSGIILPAWLQKSFHTVNKLKADPPLRKYNIKIKSDPEPAQMKYP